MVESGKFPRGQRNEPYSILKEYPQECSPGSTYYITSTFPLYRESFSLPIPKSGHEVRHPQSVDQINQNDDRVFAEPRQYGGQSSCKETAQAIGITHNPLQGSGGLVKNETQSHISTPESSPPVPGERATATHFAGGLHDTGISKDQKRMNLPRGRFRELKKNTCLLILLPELHATAFTGYCMINLGYNATILVFDKGRIILAEYDGLGGDVALDRICSHIYNRVDVLLNDLDEGQIHLALEFNSSWKISMEQSLSCFSCHEHCPVPAAEPVEVTMNRKTDIQDIRKMEIVENPEVYVPIVKIPETDVVHSPIVSESHIVPESSDRSDWKRALGMPVEGASGTAVREEEIEERLEPESGDEAGWKKALRLPVGAAIPVPQPSLSDEHRSSAPAGMSTTSEFREKGRKFDLLSPDSGLLEDKTVKKKGQRAKYPEPAEQWKFMSVNRGQNTSV